MASAQLDLTVRKYANVNAMMGISTEAFVREISEELASLIQNKVDLPQERLESYLEDAMRRLGDILIMEVTKEQELLNTS